MSIRSYRDPATGLSTTKLVKTVSKSELSTRLIERVRSAEGDLALELVDGTDAWDVAVSLNEFIGLADQVSGVLSRSNKTGKFALVADNSHVYGEFRMWQAACSSEHCDVRVFRDLDDAAAWLRSELDEDAQGRTEPFKGAKRKVGAVFSNALRPFLPSFRRQHG